MRSAESLRQLTRMQSLGDVREQRARAALQRAMATHESLTRRLHETEQAIDALVHERVSLFARHIGVMTAGDMFRLKRQESILESQRIELMLDRTRICNARAEAQTAAAHAHERVLYARRRRDKMTHVVGLFRRDIRAHVQMKEDEELEERRYDY